MFHDLVYFLEFHKWDTLIFMENAIQAYNGQLILMFLLPLKNNH